MGPNSLTAIRAASRIVKGVDEFGLVTPKDARTMCRVSSRAARPAGDRRAGAAADSDSMRHWACPRRSAAIAGSTTWALATIELVCGHNGHDNHGGFAAVARGQWPNAEATAVGRDVSFPRCTCRRSPRRLGDWV
jgi:hypothetical protein